MLTTNPTIAFCEHCSQDIGRYPYTYYDAVTGTVKYFCCASHWSLWYRARSAARKAEEDTWR